MKNKAVMTWGSVILMITFLAVGAEAADKHKKLVGTWSYEAPNAPYEYSKGQLVFTESEGNLEGKIKIGTYEISLRNLKAEGDVCSFGAYVEGEYVSLKLTLKDKTFSGKASYSEGSIDVSGKKE